MIMYADESCLDVRIIIQTIPKLVNNNEKDYNYKYDHCQQASDEKHGNTSSLVLEVWIGSLV